MKSLLGVRLKVGLDDGAVLCKNYCFENLETDYSNMEQDYSSIENT